MRFYFSILLLAMLSTLASGQCLTDFIKLLPEPALDYTETFGTISIYDDYLAVGVHQNESLGRITGLVYIYQKVSDSWRKIATLAPSDPKDGLQFGLSVKMSQDYLLVGSSKKVYLFKKPATGWKSQTETSFFFVPGSTSLGIGYNHNNALAISEDQQTIAMADIFFPVFDTGTPKIKIDQKLNRLAKYFCSSFRYSVFVITSLVLDVTIFTE